MCNIYVTPVKKYAKSAIILQKRVYKPIKMCYNGYIK